MAVQVVVLAEVIDVDEQQGKTLLMTARARGLHDQRFVKIAVIIKTREAVANCEFAKDFVHLLEFFVVFLQRLNEDLFLAQQLHLFECAIDNCGDEFEVLERFEEIIVGAGAQGGEGAVERRVARDDDDLRLLIFLFYFAQQIAAVHAGHADVRDHDVDVPVGQKHQNQHNTHNNQNTKTHHNKHHTQKHTQTKNNNNHQKKKNTNNQGAVDIVHGSALIL